MVENNIYYLHNLSAKHTPTKSKNYLDFPKPTVFLVTSSQATAESS